MNYSVIETDNKYNVYETSTDQVIKTFSNKSEAKDLMKQLNLGGGFDGWTPSFFLIKNT